MLPARKTPEQILAKMELESHLGLLTLSRCAKDLAGEDKVLHEELVWFIQCAFVAHDSIITEFVEKFGLGEES